MQRAVDEVEATSFYGHDRLCYCMFVRILPSVLSRLDFRQCCGKRRKKMEIKFTTVRDVDGWLRTGRQLIKLIKRLFKVE